MLEQISCRGKRNNSAVLAHRVFDRFDSFDNDQVWSANTFTQSVSCVSAHVFDLMMATSQLLLKRQFERRAFCEIVPQTMDELMLSFEPPIGVIIKNESSEIVFFRPHRMPVHLSNEQVAELVNKHGTVLLYDDSTCQLSVNRIVHTEGQNNKNVDFRIADHVMNSCFESRKDLPMKSDEVLKTEQLLRRLKRKIDEMEVEQ